MTMSTRRRIIIPLLGLVVVGAVVVTAVLTGGAPRSTELGWNETDKAADATAGPTEGIAKPQPGEDATSTLVGATLDVEDATTPAQQEDVAPPSDEARSSDDARTTPTDARDDDARTTPTDARDDDARATPIPKPDAESPRVEPKPTPRPGIAITSVPTGATVVAPGRTLTTPATLRCDRGQALTLRFEKPQHLPTTRTVVCGDVPKLHVVLQEP